MRKLVFAIAAVTSVVAAATVQPAPARVGEAAAQPRTWICHRAGTNKYVAIRVARSQVKGHMRHGDVAVPTASQTRAAARTFCGQLPLTAMRGGVALSGQLTGSAGTGTATIRIVRGLGRVCFRFTNLPTGFTFQLAHIHEGTTTGPIVLPLTSTGETQACVTASRALVEQLLENPGGFVVNLHNAAGTVVLSAPLSR